MHGALYLAGYSSATTAQTNGPQVVAKATMNRQEKTIRTLPAVFVSLPALSRKWPTKE